LELFDGVADAGSCGVYVGDGAGVLARLEVVRAIEFYLSSFGSQLDEDVSEVSD